MGEKTGSNSNLSAGSGSDSSFPDTRTEVLSEAAAGNWDPFIDLYLRPCWREVVITCRQRRIPMPEADDLFQELMLRLLRDSGFNHKIRSVLAEQCRDPDFHGNMPGRYLVYRQLPLRSARFRTYLKGVVRNLVLEAVRGIRRGPKQLDDQAWQALEPWIEESVTRSVDRRWVSNCLAEAAWQLKATSEKSRTRGRRRLFEILYLSTVEGRSAGQIAEGLGLGRTTISGLLSEARGRFVTLLGKITGITDLAELKDLLGHSAEDLEQALSRVQADCAE